MLLYPYTNYASKIYFIGWRIYQIYEELFSFDFTINPLMHNIWWTLLGLDLRSFNGFYVTFVQSFAT